jgi:NADH-quinone oxidoreductase subunit H
VRPCRALLLVWLAVSACVLGCAPERNAPELLTVTELLPRRVSAGDEIEVRGVNLPVGDAGNAEVIFRGNVHRPGEPVLPNVEIVVENARLERERVRFEVSGELAERFTGRADDARHATFRGTLAVWLPSQTHGLPVRGTLKGTTVLDVEARPLRRALADEIEREADRAQAFLGITLAPSSGDAGRFSIQSVRDGSPAARGGLQPGDLLESFDGVTVLDATDVLPSGHDRRARAVVTRGAHRHEVEIDVSGFRGDASRELMGAGVVLGALLVVMLAFGTRLGGAATWLVHRVARVLRPTRDNGGFIGLMARTSSRGLPAETSANPLLAAAGPLLVVFGATGTFAALAWVELRRVAELDLAILYLVSLTAFVTIGVLTGGWSERRSPVLRRLETLAVILVCEIPAACALGSVILLGGSMRVRDVVLAQEGAPWHWTGARSPLLFALFMCFFARALVGRQPSIQVGTKTPGSVRRLAFMLAEWTNLFAMCAIGALAFLGGFCVPGIASHEQVSSGWLVALGILLFVAKSWCLAAGVLCARAALPRLGAGAVLRLGARFVMPLTAAALAATTILVAYPLLPTVARMVEIAVLAVASVISGTLVVSVVAQRDARGRVAHGRLVRVNTLL